MSIKTPNQKPNKKILFDLDETLVTNDLVKIASERVFKNGLIWEKDKITGKDVKEFDFSDINMFIKKELINLFSDVNEGALKKVPIPGVLYLLHYLNKKNYDIGIITARPKVLKDVTDYCIYRDFKDVTWNLGINFINDKDIIDTDNKHSKYEILAKIKPDIYVDDSPLYCEEAAKACLNSKIYLISNKHTGWSRHYTPKNPRIKKVKSVLEIGVI